MKKLEKKKKENISELVKGMKLTTYNGWHRWGFSCPHRKIHDGNRKGERKTVVNREGKMAATG